jgi:transglutaminase-like putative cysteine protease
MIIVDGPSQFPEGAVYELGDVDLRESRQFSPDYQLAMSSTSRQDFDEANVAYYRELFSRLSSDKQSDEERVLAVNRYVADKLNYEGKDPSSSRRTVLERGSQFCGELAGAMATVLAAANFKTRQIDMTEGGERPGTHVVVEVYYDGGWHLFDPTYGTVYRRRDGEVANYQDLRCEPGLISRDHFARLEPGIRRSVFGLMLAVYGSGHHHYYVFKD